MRFESQMTDQQWEEMITQAEGHLGREDLHALVEGMVVGAWVYNGAPMINVTMALRGADGVKAVEMTLPLSELWSLTSSAITAFLGAAPTNAAMAMEQELLGHPDNSKE